MFKLVHRYENGTIVRSAPVTRQPDSETENEASIGFVCYQTKRLLCHCHYRLPGCKLSNQIAFLNFNQHWEGIFIPTLVAANASRLPPISVFANANKSEPSARDEAGDK